MRKSILVELANGDSWVLAENKAGLFILEEVYGGAPAFAVLGDNEDLSCRRLPAFIYSLSYSFRRGDSKLAALTFTQFLEGPWLPTYESEEWEALAKRVGTWIAETFPEAVRKGLAILTAAREARKLGLSTVSTPSLQSGTGVAPAVPDTNQQEPSTGLLSDTTPSLP